ncbi:MAG: RagB/SusD family nutrient uptake outer membrane protein [Tannerella sp.]|jgi:hypothetical protein|nr:RagB/SusD family nutrient uptake outer membrane protein [Tannerella sp.]
MKKNIYSLLFLVLLLMPFSSCNDFLDKQPLDQYGENAVWGDLALVETFVNNIYYQIPHGFQGKIGMPMVCDEAMRVSDRGASDVTRSLITPSNFSIFDNQPLQQKYKWDHVYKQVRACNLFLEQIEEHTYEDEALKQRLTGEVYFLRAYYYHMLTFMYGGVPIVTKTYDLNEDHLIARNSFADCISFISEDCDKAANLLPLKHDAANLGRATKGASLALKARTLLYAASELYHNSSWASGYSNRELISYTDADRAACWRAAKDAAKAVMDLGVYDLYKKIRARMMIWWQISVKYLLQKRLLKIFFSGLLPRYRWSRQKRTIPDCIIVRMAIMAMEAIIRSDNWPMISI